MCGGVCVRVSTLVGQLGSLGEQGGDVEGRRAGREDLMEHRLQGRLSHGCCQNYRV